MHEERLPLVGRDGELAILAETHRVVADGHGKLVLLSSEAGGGRTGLMLEFLDRLPPAVARGRGGAVALGDQVMALLPFRTALADLDRSQAAGPRPTDTASTDDRDEREQAVAAMLDRLAGATAGTVLVIEDLHWADEASLAMLALLVSQLSTLPVLLVCTFRSDEANEALAAVVSELGRNDDVIRLELDGLTRADIAELHAMAHDEPADQVTLDRLVERTGGNAFFVIESLGDPVGEAVPLPVEDHLNHRLQQLPEPVLEVITLVAITGRVSVDELTELTTQTLEVFADAVRAAVETNVLVVDDDMVVFRHALLAEAALQRVLPFEARAVHRRLAEVLDRATDDRGRGEESAPVATLDLLARRARHWNLAGESEQAFRAAAMTAARAAADGYSAVALRNLSTVLDRWSAVDRPEVMAGRSHRDVLLAASDAAVEVGRSDEGVRLATLAFEESDEPGPRAEAAWKCGYARYSARDLEGAYRFMTAESAKVIDADADIQVARLLVATIGMAMSIGEYHVGIDCDQRIVAMVEQLDDPQLTGWLRSFRGACLATTDDPRAGLAMMDSAIEPLTEAGDLGYVLNTTLNRIIAGFPVEHIDTLLERAEQGLAALPQGPTSRAMALSGLHGELLNHAGRTEEAWALYQGGATRFVWRTAAERAITLGMLALEAGDVERAGRLARSADVATSELNPPMALRAELLRCRILAEDEPERAARELVQQVADASPVSAGLHGALALTYAWEWLNDAARRHRDFTAVSGRQLRGRVAPDSPVGAWRRLLAAQLAGNDLGTWGDAVDGARAAGLVEVQSRALLGTAEAELAIGDRRAAAERIDEAAVLAESISNHLLDRSARELARRVGGTGRFPVTDRPDDSADAPIDPTIRFGLTPREVDVLLLVADGRTNAEIGTELYISAKTASVHVSNLLRKLDVPNRRDAARLARQHGLG